MGTLIYLDGAWSPAASYSVTEHGTPTYAGDTSGGVGSVRIEIPAQATGVNGARVNPNAYKGKSFSIEDTEYGSVSGIVVGISESSGITTLDCLPRLHRLNIYNVSMPPFGGSLTAAFNAYLDKAKVPVEDRRISSAADGTDVHLPGWTGELWLHLKQLAAAFNYDIQTAGKQIIIEPQRRRVMETIGWVDKQSAWNPVTKASYVEVYQYASKWYSDYPFYPVSASDSNVVNLKAGEQTITQIDLRGSVKRFRVKNSAGQNVYATAISPVYDENLNATYTGESRFCITYGKGTRVTRDRWVRGGGRLTVKINPDTFTATVTGVGPVGVIDGNGNAIDTFNVAIVQSGITYDGLRLRGEGVRVTKSKRRFATGADIAETETEIGVTVDNIFLNSWNQVANAGIDAATFSSFGRWTSTATLNGAIRTTSGNPETDQIIGTMGGMRFFDERTSSFYRVRQASISPKGISVDNADLDNTFGDFDEALGGETYEGVAARYPGMTYEQVRAVGLPGLTSGILGG